LSEAGFQDLRELFDHPLFADRKAEVEAMQPLLGMRSSYFLLRAWAEVAGKEQRLYSVLQRRNRVVGAIARATGTPCPGAGKGPRDRDSELEKLCAIPL
jgi:general secretion pathway protein K